MDNLNLPTEEEIISEGIKGALGRSTYEPRLGSGKHPCEGASGESQTLELGGVKARVDRVNVEGLVRTKDEVVRKAVSDLFVADNFGDMIAKAHTVRNKLTNLGCFRNIAIHIDTSEGAGATPNGYEVTYQVEEMKRLCGGVTSRAEDNQGFLTVAGGLPNLRGGGEALRAEVSYGSRDSRAFQLALIKPFVTNRNVVGALRILQEDATYPMSGYVLRDRGIVLDFGWDGRAWRNLLQFRADWRTMLTGENIRFSAFETREDSGNSLKCAIVYSVFRDLRDSVVFPTCGTLHKFSTELAAGAGNILKHEFTYQINKSYYDKNLIYQWSNNLGLMWWESNQNDAAVFDNFFLGGPTSMRGFKMRGMGPQSEGNFVGGEFFWATGLHIFTPLPYCQSLKEVLKFHLFLNMGNLEKRSEVEADADPESFRVVNFIKHEADAARISLGLGLALRLGQMARCELNLVFPVKTKEDDALVTPFQFGVGLQFI